MDWLRHISPVPSSSPEGYSDRSLCGSTNNSAGWIEPKRVIYDHELVMIQKGRYRIQIDDVNHELEANSFIIIPPRRWHTTTCLQEGLRHYVHFDWLAVPVEHDVPVMTFYPALPKRRWYRDPPDWIPEDILSGEINSTVIYELMQRLNLMLESDDPSVHLISRAVFLELILHLFSEPAPASSSCRRTEILAYHVRESLDGIPIDAWHTLSIRSLLSQLGYSYEHLARIFRQQYGLTPLGYVQSIRIERAKYFLNHTDMKIDSIAQEIGYADSSYFSKLFKRLTGQSPNQYRAQL